MNIQKILTVCGIAGVLLATPLHTFAQTVTPGANQAARLVNLHSECDTQITNRINSLNSAATRINGLGKLSSDQKTQFTGEVTTDINNLTALKTTCDGDTDIMTLRKDDKTVFTTYRVYAEFLPQLHLLIASDTMSVTAEKLSDLSKKLQIRVQSAGNPSNLTALLSDMQARTADAKTQYNNVQSQITPLTPQSYDNNPTGTMSTLNNARSEIKTSAGDLKTAWIDAKQIFADLKTSTTLTPSP